MMVRTIRWNGRFTSQTRSLLGSDSVANMTRKISYFETRRFKDGYVHSESEYVHTHSPLHFIQPNGQEKTYEYTNTRDKLIIDSGEKVVNKSTKEFVPLQGNFHGSHAEPASVRMGEVKADADGRLIFVAGDGLSYALGTKDKPPSEQPPLKESFDNDDWVASFHNTCTYQVC